MEFNYIKDSTTIEYDLEKTNIVITKYEYPVLNGSCGLDEKSFKNVMEVYKSGFNLEVKNNKVVASMDKKTIKFNTRAYEELSLNNEFEDSAYIKVSAKALKQAIKFVDKKSTINVCGVYVSPSGICATDKFIMYINGAYAQGGKTLDLEFIKNILAYNEEEYTIYFNNNLCKTSIVKENKTITIYGRLIAEAYPNLEKVLNHSYDNSIKLNTQDTKELIKYCGSGDEILFNADEKSIETIGSVEVKEECETINKSFKITYEHLAKVLSIVEVESLELEIGTNTMLCRAELKDNVEIVFTQVKLD